MRRLRALILLLIMIAASAAAYAQVRERDLSDFFRRRSRETEAGENVPYDGRVAFVRLRFPTTMAGMSRRGSNGEVPWAHDYPTADVHMMKILNELTLLRPHIEGSNVFRLSDPELSNYPIAYMSEPGYWVVDDEEAVALRKYLLKGGFIIFDDFQDFHFPNLEQQMRRVLPEANWVELDSTHPIFHSFFEIDDLRFLTSYSDSPSYWGLFEDNDPRKRLIAIANRDGDHGEYWEFSDQGYVPVDLSNQAYKFGVNYFMYALTH